MIFHTGGQIEGFERHGIRLLSPDQVRAAMPEFSL